MSETKPTSVPDEENRPLGIDDIDGPGDKIEIDGVTLRVVWIGEDGEGAFVIGHPAAEELFRRALAESGGWDVRDRDYGEVVRRWIACRLHMPDCREDLEPDEGCQCEENWAWWASYAQADDEGAVAVTWWTA